jgi:hypothetical protein
MNDTPKTSGVSRRAMLVGTLRAGAYVAPAVVSAAVVAPVAAVTPAPCTQPVTLAQDAVLYNAAPNFTYNVLLQPNGAGPFLPQGTITTNAAGFGFTTFAVTYDSSQVTFLRLSVIVPGADPVTQPAAPPFDAPLIGLTACPRTALLRMRAFNVPTAAACALGGVPTDWQVFVDASVLNASPNTAYDFYAQPNGSGAFQFVGHGTTNAQGNLLVIAPIAFTGTEPGSVVLNVVPAGAAPTPAAFTATASGGTLTTTICPPPGVTAVTARGAHLVGLR